MNQLLCLGIISEYVRLSGTDHVLLQAEINNQKG